MDTQASETAAAPVAAGPASAPASSRRRGGLAGDLVLLGIVGVLLVAAIAAGTAAVYREFYSPSAFVQRYLSLLQEGRAADALAVAGVSVDSAELEAAGLPASASEALLRRAALASLDQVRVVSEDAGEEGTVAVTVAYRAGAFPGTTTFQVARNGWIGVAPAWRFAHSPLAVLELSVAGSMSVEVNGFAIDKRQVSPDGVDADPLAPVSLLVFSPGIYAVSVDTPISAAKGLAVLSDSPLARVPVQIEATATERFVERVQESVDGFLAACAEQEVLQPTGCPFGFYVQDRIVSPPVWSISSQPVVTLTPEGGGWRIADAPATAHIEVSIRSIFDGSVRTVSEDVPFVLTGTIAVQPDGEASITVTTPGG